MVTWPSARLIGSGESDAQDAAACARAEPAARLPDTTIAATPHANLARTPAPEIGIRTSNYNLRVSGTRAAASLFLMACVARGTSAADAVDKVSRTLALPSTRAIRLEATIADLTIIGSNRSDVAVEIVRHAPQSADFSRFPAVLDSTTEGVHLAVGQA